MTTREAFEKGTEAFNNHDAAGFAAVLADDVVFRAPGGQSGEGKQACARSYAVWFEAFPDCRVEIRGAHFAGDVVVEEGTFIGTHKGTLPGPDGGIAPTGRQVRVDYVQVMRFRDGKTAALDLMYDRMEMAEQLGLVPSAGLSRAA